MDAPLSTGTAAARFGPDGRFELQARERRLIVDGVAVELGARAFDLLLALADTPGQLLTKNELMDRVWPGLIVVENNLAAQITALRKVLGGDLIVTIPGRGYRFTATLDAVSTPPTQGPAADPGRVSAQARRAAHETTTLMASVAAAAAPADAAPALRTNLPESLPPLIGRDEDLAALGVLVEAHRLITLVGAGGMGKTRLAQAFLHAHRDAYRHGVCWVELSTVNDPAALAGAIALALGVRPPAGEPLAGLAGAIAPLQMLVALDNAEQLLADVARVAQALLDQAPGLRLIVTSQAPLKLAAERVFRLEALAVPQGPLPAAQAREFGAVALFTERAQAADVRFALTDANAPAVIALCGALDGLALAIELAAARVAMFGVQRLAASMQDRLQLLTASRDRTAQARHQTLRAALEWSHGLLDARDRAVFRRLAVFSGSASLALIQRVVADPPELAAVGPGRLDEWAVLDALGDLVDRSLVAVLGGGGDDIEPRYRLLDSPRALALEQLQAAGEQAALRDRHAQALAAHFDAQWHARYAGHIGVDAWKHEIGLDAPNAATAIAWATHAGQVDCALTIAATWLHAMHRTMHAERMALADTCGALGERTATPELRLRAALAAARAWTNPRKRRAFAAVDRALGLARQLDAAAPDRWLLYRALGQWVVSGSSLADTPPAALVAALAELDAIEDRAWPPHRLDVGLEAHSFFLSRTDAGPGAPARLLMLSRRRASIAAEIGDDAETMLNNLIDAELAAGDAGGAAASGQALLAQLANSRNENIMAFARLNLGACWLALDDTAQALPVLQSAWAKAPAFELPASPTPATARRPRSASPTRPRPSTACARWRARCWARRRSTARRPRARR
ncbi:MAG: winged helix-turn-helix domain-containing protein [Betaproteobacteria bacterium]